MSVRKLDTGVTEDIIAEILYVLKTGISWRNIRSKINYNTLYWHYKRLTKYEIFNKVYERLLNT